MPDIDKAKAAANQVPVEQRNRYRELYNVVSKAMRMSTAAGSALNAYHHEMLVENDVPVGKTIDWWKNGEIKDKADCEQPPEVN